jgi:hypothetical protein
MAVCLSCGVFGQEPQNVSKRDQTNWVRWLVPLPKEVGIPQKLVVAPADVKLTLLDDAPASQRALRHLQQLFLDKAGADGTGTGPEIVLGLLDANGKVGGIAVPDAERLAKLPNRDQAYLIRPLPDGKIVLAARTQLLESAFKGDSVSLPLAAITDWPDLEERGLWGGSSVRDIEWMAERKMNVVEFHSPHSVTPDGKMVAKVSPVLLARGRTNAVTMIPIISHINHLGRRGVYKAYPELRGKGKKALIKSHGSELYAPCASNPKLREILAGWMVAFAKDPQVRDICCWLGELAQGCECEECVRKGQFVAEAEAFVGAWRIARKTVPDLRIRILLTQGSYSSNDKVLAVIPPEVGVTYYDGGRTYDSSKEPMIYPLLEDFAAKGRWLGVYPQLTPSWRIVSPWSAPQFVRARMTEFCEKKLRCLIGYVVPNDQLYDFNVTGAAEWSWNSTGRDEREFAIAWATRHGLKQPERVADWALTTGEIGWDFYGARGVERYFFVPPRIAALLKSRTPIQYGEGLFRYIPDREYLQQNHVKSQEAVRLALDVGTLGMVAESRTIESYYRMLVQLADMAQILADSPVVGMKQRTALQKLSNEFVLAGMQNMDALKEWEQAVGKGSGTGRFRDGVDGTGNTVAAVGAVLEKVGVRQPAAYGRSVTVGGWESEDFRETNVREKEIDVSQWVTGPGTYLVTMQYTHGWNGAATLRAALAASAKGKGTPRTDVAVDEHAGSTGWRSKGNVYRLVLDTYDPSKRYWLLTKFRGTRPQDQVEGKTGCEGKITLEREAPPDVVLRIMNTPPMSAEECPVPGKTPFKGKGIRVGVVVGGYGSEGILETLRKTSGIDAVPVATGRLLADQCQVIILPQMRGNPPPDKAIKALESYVKKGGGLITTHDAVGYRSMPKILPKICAGGKEHVRHERWQIADGKHPLANGLPAGQALSQTYFDHIQLTPGPEGTTVAVSGKTKQPVVVAGTTGKGRYVACGLLLGTDADAEEAPATGPEATLLLNAIRWCASGGK